MCRSKARKGSWDYIKCLWFPGKSSSAKGQYRESQHMHIEFMGIELCVHRYTGWEKIKGEGREKKGEKGVE